jgi:glycine cleavage system transcriptional repressor
MSLHMTDSRLLISSVARQDLSHLRDLTGRVVSAECGVEESHVALMGEEIAVLMLVSGNWNAIAKLESALAKLNDKDGVTLSVRRTGPRIHEGDRLPYVVEVVAADSPGIVHHLAGFFSSRNITIDGLVSTCYEATQTGTAMFSAHISVSIPAKVQIAALREEFMDFCDRMNLDAILEPVKT